jgi:hypothetical protein
VPRSLERSIGLLLVVVHGGLALWALVGFAELALAQVPWNRVSNPLFSTSMLLLQWSLIATAAGVFIVGYTRRWHGLPVAMSIIYGMMAATCAYQTFFILTHAGRFRAMAIEYAEYAAILGFLFYTERSQLRAAP